MLIALVRHGESTANADGIVQGRGDYPLGPRGREQALRLASALRAFQPYRIYTSPLTRARETAAIINRPHGTETIVLPTLLEYDLGAFEGLTFKEIKARFPNVTAELAAGKPFHLLAPGGETDESAEQRARAALDEVLDAGLPRLIVVSHLGLLERLIRLAIQEHRLEGLDPAAAFPLKNASITILDFQPRLTVCLSCNDVSHLD